MKRLLALFAVAFVASAASTQPPAHCCEDCNAHNGHNCCNGANPARVGAVLADVPCSSQAQRELSTGFMPSFGRTKASPGTKPQIAELSRRKVLSRFLPALLRSKRLTGEIRTADETGISAARHIQTDALPNCVLPCPSSLCGGPSRRRFPRCCQKRALGSAPRRSARP